MKRKSPMLCMLPLLALLSLQAFAQDEPIIPAVPKWVSEKGYWQIENTIKTPGNFLIYFFNNDGTMVYKEKVEGVKLNIRKRKTLMRLKNVLDQSVTAWENDHLVKENERLVAAALKRNG